MRALDTRRQGASPKTFDDKNQWIPEERDFLGRGATSGVIANSIGDHSSSALAQMDS